MTADHTVTHYLHRLASNQALTETLLATLYSKPCGLSPQINLHAVQTEFNGERPNILSFACNLST